MKSVIIAVVIIAAAGVAGYFGFNVILEKQTAGLKTDVLDLKQRIQKIEENAKAALIQISSNSSAFNSKKESSREGLTNSLAIIFKRFN